MTDHPILFSADMTRALLAGTKTQTRRVLKPQPALSFIVKCDEPYYWGDEEGETSFKIKHEVGDRLWVRESWRTESDYYNDLKPSDMSGEETLLFNADGDWSDNKSAGRVRASMHMPRWASRITLDVTDVKIERLQDISESDAIAEGIEETTGIVDIKNYGNGPVEISGTLYFSPHEPDELFDCPIEAYEHLWNSINGPDAWVANPWVVATSFEVKRENIDGRVA